MTYEETSDLLVSRIVALIPAHPEILTMATPWGLFKIPEFRVSDLGPSYAQAMFALRKAQALNRE